MREAEHRVKNNLSLVSSLVNLQASELADPDDRDKMKLVSDRIQSIVLLHEKLSLSVDLRNIAMRDYLRELIAGIRSTRGDGKPDIKIESDSVDVIFEAKLISLLGLIITELVTNALKYGYPDRIDGLIEVILDKIDKQDYRLTVRNDGIALSDDLDFETPKSLGILLVKKLVEDMDAEMIITRSPNPSFEILFRKD
ncbi:MAG: sensor histidine kinase [Spirochaetales bacterium]|uniref:histidine kinase n=1 Tax=Candidatus Thalassospirochaeta sargassi TaxID=3119039 RepID=A0AAJ1MMN8_9SPIO|nr:sensor histidine kinase [Spirochaetales bacterium]